ncbi:UDP-N-acetylglucosamine 4,6-dehydratase (inverting) [Nonomuraea sp. NPDC049725]|uniref:UDP-N-acetylglucosamine 4,6-dehydratase (inverting) n=1 Tax=Nonomuraea sp. NPDC049725 TaxID=3154508 RepID=UPI00342B6A72
MTYWSRYATGRRKGDRLSILSGSSMLITGGTGSFGKAFIRHALGHVGVRRLVVFSRDELKQYELRQALGEDERLRYFIGDVRDRERLARAMHGVEYVVHAAALKQVDTAEYNPFEYVRTNVAGSQNVVEAAIDCGVRKVVALSTDKASSPINLYGATKLVADKLFVSANHYAAGHETRFAVVRYGNVVGSRGSVVPFFLKLARQGASLPITDKRMTRFWITLDQAVEFVVDSFDLMQGGELYVPRIPSMRIVDLADALAPGSPIYEIGIRPGEKLHEEMIGPDDGRRALRLADRYVVQPTIATWGYVPPVGGEVLPEGFAYRSDANDRWLSVDDLRAMVSA